MLFSCAVYPFVWHWMGKRPSGEQDLVPPIKKYRDCSLLLFANILYSTDFDININLYSIMITQRHETVPVFTLQEMVGKGDREEL